MHVSGVSLGLIKKVLVSAAGKPNLFPNNKQTNWALCSDTGVLPKRAEKASIYPLKSQTNNHSNSSGGNPTDHLERRVQEIKEELETQNVTPERRAEIFNELVELLQQSGSTMEDLANQSEFLKNSRLYWYWTNGDN